MIYAVLDSQYKIDGFDPREVISLTFSEAKFTDIVQRGGTLSNQVKIAKTSNNQRVLGLLDDSNANTPQAYRLFNADLYVDNLKIFSGNAQILESNEFFTIRFFSSSAGFFNRIKGRKLNTIDLSSFNHAWTAVNVNNRRTGTSGVVYPNINYGLWTDIAFNAKAHTEWFPAVYVQTLFNEIATELGYTYNALNNFTKALPFSKKDFTNNISIEAGLSLGADDTYLVAASAIGVDFDTLVSDPLDYFVSNNGNGWELPAGNVKVSGTINYSTLIGNNDPVTVGLYQNNGGTLLNEIISVAPGGSGTIDYEFSISNPLGFGNLVIAIDGNTNGDSITIESGSTFFIDEGELEILDGNTIAIQDTLPDLNIIDLFKYVAVKENALIVVDDVAKTLEFVRFNAITNRFFEATNLDGNIQDPNKIKRYYRLNDYAQNNYLDYKIADPETDPTSRPESRGRGLFTIADTNLDFEKILYEAPFYRTGRFTGFKTKPIMVLIPRYSDTALSYDEPDISPGIRIVDVVIDTSLEVQVTGQPLPSPQANATFAGFTQDITNNYQTFVAALNQCKIVEVPLNVDNQDLANIDFTKPVHLLDAYWYIMEIKQYEVNRPTATTFKLLRLF